MYHTRVLCIIFTLVLAIGMTIHTAEADDDITISTGHEIYYSGDFVVIFGSVQTVFPDMPVTIKIIQDSNVVRVAQIEVAKDGTFYESFKASGPYWTNDGTYQISAQYSTMTEVIAFEFYQKMINQSSAAFPISIPNSGSFDVGYTIRGGEVNDMSMNKVRSSLLIETTMNSNGNLILKLPRESFDSQKNDGVDDTFIILVSKGNNAPEDFAQVQYDEIGTGFDYRTIRIPLEEGDKWIDIIGTYVIPEFGSIAIIILVVSVSSAIIISKGRLSVRYN
jgi:predicted secreted protein with PEFG-CTERM motif